MVNKAKELCQKIEAYCENLAETGYMDRMEAIDLLHDAQKILSSVSVQERGPLSADAEERLTRSLEQSANGNVVSRGTFSEANSEEESRDDRP